jgi:O-antigen/teichoic acid export membrane protein
MLKNIGSNWILMLVSMVVAYLMLPFTLRHLGNDQYGTWLLITSFTGYLGLLVLGVPMASVRFITRDASLRNYSAMNRTIATCAGMYLLIGLISLIIGVALKVVFDHMYQVPESIHQAVKISYLIVVSVTSASFFAQLPHGIMASHHDFVGRNMVQTASIVTRFIFTVVLLTLWPSLLMLAFVQLIPVVLESSILWMVIKRRYPEVKLNFSLFDGRQMREIFSFSIFVLILNLGIQLSFQTDSLVIGKMLQIGQIPYYAVANTIMVYAMQFVIGIAGVVMPMATRLQAQEKQEELRALFFKWSQITLALSLIGCLDLIIFGPGLIRAWIGPEFEKSSGAVLQVLMLSGLVFLPVRGVVLPVLMGIGKPRKATITFLIAGLMNLVLSIALAHPYGIVGIAVGTAIPNVFFATVLLLIAARELNFSVREYLVRVAKLPAVAGASLAVILLWWQRIFHPVTLLGVFLAMIVSVVVYVPLWIIFVSRDDDELDARGYLQRAWERARP